MTVYAVTNSAGRVLRVHPDDEQMLAGGEQLHAVEDWPGFPPEAWRQVEIVSGNAVIVDTRTLATAKAARWVAVKAQRDAIEFGPIQYDGSTFDGDERSQDRIKGGAQMAMLALMNSQAFSIDWTLADNSTRALTGAQMIGVALAMGAAIDGAHQAARVLRLQIEAATTLAEVDAVTW